MYLWVRNTVHGDTKTAASVRIVPLLEHLSEAEAGVIEQLLGYAEAGYAGEPLVPLMAESIGQRALLDRYGAASYLHALLRQLTGDNSLRYHHMRHGWVTRIAAWQHGLEVPGFNRDEMLNALAWRTFIGDGVSAYPLRSLATAVGHANGATTLASYTHSVELIAQASLRRAAPVLDDFGQAYALQIAYATIRRRRNRGPHSGRPAAIPVPDIATVQRKRPVLSTWHRQAAALPLSLVVVDRFLRRYGSPGGSLRAARDLLIPQAQAAELLHRAVRLENASGYHGYGLARHSDDPLVRAGDRGDRSRQFRREDQRMSSLLSGLDQQIDRLDDTQRQALRAGLAVWERTLLIGEDVCVVTELLDLQELLRALHRLGAYVSSEVCVDARNPLLGQELSAAGITHRFGRVPRARGLGSVAVKLSPTAVGPKRSLKRLMFVLRVYVAGELGI